MNYTLLISKDCVLFFFLFNNVIVKLFDYYGVPRSLQITPACNLPLKCIRNNGKIVIVNLQVLKYLVMVGYIYFYFALSFEVLVHIWFLQMIVYR